MPRGGRPKRTGNHEGSGIGPRREGLVRGEPRRTMATSRYGREGLPRSGFVQDPYCDLPQSTDRRDKFVYFRVYLLRVDLAEAGRGLAGVGVSALRAATGAVMALHLPLLTWTTRRFGGAICWR
jgi:hypothetical protein